MNVSLSSGKRGRSLPDPDAAYAVDGNAGLCSDVNGIWFKAGTLGYNIGGVAAGNYRVRPYLLDFGGNRAEDVKACVLDSSDVLKACSDPVAMATFGIGEWAAFDVKLAAGDKVRFEHTQTAGDNAVVSGVIFDPLAADPPCANGIACANGLDTATHGDWPLVPYGTAGRIIFNRTGPTGINVAPCPVVDATTYVDKFTTAVTVAADNGVCQYRWDCPINGCDNLEDAMTWVHAPRVNTGDPLTCIPADNRGFNVPAECQHLYNVCVGPSDPTTQVYNRHIPHQLRLNH